MTTQTLELHAVTDEELIAVAGGRGSPFTRKFTDAEWKALEARDHDHGLQSLGSHNVATMS